ncbi:MAG TPA: Tad domain-containing protein [Candidatus Limnocylindrales bacterium]|nr:Tad domain-containing protein [Candidatus Limnocylindrales bacterium]
MHALWRATQRRSGESGQALVIMVGVMLLSMALLAVIVDGGNVLTQQRVAQTGADSTAEAGAIVFASRLAGVPAPADGWDAEVNRKLTQSAAANKVIIKSAYYTDICGIPLKLDGSAALNGDGSENLGAAAAVGNGSLPGGSATTPDCPSLTVGPVAGVLVVSQLNVGTYVARSIGIPTITVNTNATSVAGYLQGFCAASEGVWCAVLPVTIPVNTVTCDGSGNLTTGDHYWDWNVVLTVPLCKSSPGNVGWLDWTPPGGGASELVCEIVNPNNPAIRLPSWQFVTSTGNVNGGGGCTDDDTGVVYSGVEGAVRKYDGTNVLIPQFDMNCWTGNSDPDPNSEPPAVNTAPKFGCPNTPGGGSGQNLWYRMPSFAYFQLCDPSMPECGGRYGAYMSGSNQAECDTGNGATSCLVGKFIDILSSGTVGPGVGAGAGNKALGVQLIR